MLPVRILGYSDVVGTAELTILKSDHVEGNIVVDNNDLKANLYFIKNDKIEEISGTLSYSNEQHNVQLDNKDLISLTPVLMVHGFIIGERLESKSTTKSQSLHNASCKVIQAIISKELTIEQTVDMVIHYIRTGVFNCQK